jgi:CheY-like chemotaxis protein
LGLFCLSKRLESLHGRCGVSSRKDNLQGSLFWFEIPYHPVSDHNSSIELRKKPDIISRVSSPTRKIYLESADPKSNKSDRFLKIKDSDDENEHGDDEEVEDYVVNPLKILLVEDTISIAKMCMLLLKRDGHDIHHAVNGADAISKIHAFSPFDCVIMDIQMPIMDGLEATRKIREAEIDSNCRQFIIGCSANSDNQTILDAQQAGVDTFMSKPFSLKTFYQKYRDCGGISTLFEI